MTHSKECEQVLRECDFPEDAYRWVERRLTRFYGKQIIQLVWSKDPKGIHPWDWFDPFFANGYVPSKRIVNVRFTEEFWETYELVGDFVEPYSTELLSLIDEMAGDTQRVIAAMKRSKPNLKYLWKVWSDTEGTRDFTDKDLLPEIKAYHVETDVDIT